MSGGAKNPASAEKWLSQARVSSDNPRLNAFCRVAPSVLFKRLAIFPALTFLRASAFSSLTCIDVQARLFFPFFISPYLHV